MRSVVYARIGPPEDFATSAERFDLIVAVNGDRSILDFRRVLAPRGRCVVVGGSGAQTGLAPGKPVVIQ